jgi:hypothetical protein
MSGERGISAEDSIKVVCRFRPLNESEERAGARLVVKFPSGPEENSLSIAVSNCFKYTTLIQKRMILDFVKPGHFEKKWRWLQPFLKNRIDKTCF